MRWLDVCDQYVLVASWKDMSPGKHMMLQHMQPVDVASHMENEVLHGIRPRHADRHVCTVCRRASLPSVSDIYSTPKPLPKTSVQINPSKPVFDDQAEALSRIISVPRVQFSRSHGWVLAKSSPINPLLMAQNIVSCDQTILGLSTLGDPMTVACRTDIADVEEEHEVTRAQSKFCDSDRVIPNPSRNTSRTRSCAVGPVMFLFDCWLAGWFISSLTLGVGRSIGHVLVCLLASRSADVDIQDGPGLLHPNLVATPTSFSNDLYVKELASSTSDFQ
ncbi:hypothetical protein F2Q69_00028475 [Brassica cretica]|uniref:Uncharacterized protein n=1 Tax=Brassica cretica TaxID=69181 RepID=A0A8S9S192_BRACR|nr:hypothetical protein F2Q69_00028475 [Brassica cretica]